MDWHYTHFIYAHREPPLWSWLSFFRARLILERVCFDSNPCLPAF
jgi:hypothetical protein